MIGGVAHARGERCVEPTHRTAARIDEVLDRIEATALKYVSETDEIALDIRLRRLKAIANSRLRCEVDHVCKAVALKERVECWPVAEILMTERESRLIRELIKARSLEFEVIICVEVIEPDDLLTAR